MLGVSPTGSTDRDIPLREGFGHFVGQLPRIALDARDQFRPDALESLNGIVVVEADSGRQSWHDVLDQAACEFSSIRRSATARMMGLPSGAR